jgi:hypothetical protein
MRERDRASGLKEHGPSQHFHIIQTLQFEQNKGEGQDLSKRYWAWGFDRALTKW